MIFSAFFLGAWLLLFPQGGSSAPHYDKSHNVNRRAVTVVKNNIKTENKFLISRVWGDSDLNTSHLTNTAICDCEKIRKTKKCDNPDCLKICNLENLFSEIEKKVQTDKQKKCLTKEDINTSISKENISAVDTANFFNDVVNIIEENDIKTQNQVKEKCPDCHIQTKMSAKADLVPPENQEKTCDDKYLKNHQFKKIKKAELKEGESCDEKRKREINEYFSNYVSDIVKGNDEEISDELYESCPSQCSFATTKLITINDNSCEGELTLNINCTHKGKREKILLIDMPVYNISVDYSGELICKEEEE